MAKKKLQKLLAVLLAGSMTMGIASTAALAVDYDLSTGSVHVEDNKSWQDGEGATYTADNKYDHTEDKEIKISQSNSEEATSNTVQVGENVSDVTITLKDVNIEAKQDSAVSIGEGSSVTIELDGKNILKGDDGRAGLEVKGDSDAGDGKDTNATVIIQDGNNDGGSLDAVGGINSKLQAGGAGIGGSTLVGGDYADGNSGNITIDSGKITATGGSYAAGIGGGGTARDLVNTGAGNITINGGTVNATGGNVADITLPNGIVISGSSTVAGGAGIGGGNNGDASNITIAGGNVTAVGSIGGAGIGSGSHEAGSNSNEGKITISGGTVKAEGNGGAAGIGGGYMTNTGTVVIEGDADVNAHANRLFGTCGAGVGSGNKGYDVDGTNAKNDITIQGNANVNASSEYASAGIGGGQSQSAGNITINTTGKVTATGSSSGSINGGAGIGGGAGGYSGTIHIQNGDVTATGGSGAAAIGSGGNYRTVKNETEYERSSVTISGGKVQATATGKYGSGIGSGISGDVKSIEISGNADVTATGSAYAPGIGAGYLGTFGDIIIDGSTVYAKSGLYASAIGNGYKGDGGTIRIDNSDLEAYGDLYFAIDTRSTLSSEDNQFINGRFLEELGKLDSNGLNKKESVEFVVVDKDGKEVNRFTLPLDGDNLYNSFAVNVPKDGTYFIFNADGVYGNKGAGYVVPNKSETEGGKQVAYVVNVDAILSADKIQFPKYDVNYGFESGTDGKELPQEVLDKLPGGSMGNDVTSIDPTITPDALEPVKVPGGTWTFSGWQPSGPVVDENGVVGDVTLVGTWVFTPDDVPGGSDPEGPGGDKPGDKPGEDIGDPDVPKTDIPGTEVLGEELTDPDVPMEDLPDEDIPQSDVPKTGDMASLWLALTALSGTGLAGVSLLGRKKRDEE